LIVKNLNQKYLQFRQEYPFFEYQSYSFKITNEYLEANYCFNLSDKVKFNPVVKILLRRFNDLDSLEISDLNNLVFHIGMVEMISYWKATCSKKVIVPHKLEPMQIEWWKKLYYLGLGEFFYINGIDANMESFMTIMEGETKLNTSEVNLDFNRVMVPIGGGKDSVVSLELLKNSELDVIPMILNPREASIKTIENAGYSENDSQIVLRSIDGNLLDLNQKGFLNGHTPFSALLAFTGALCCIISGVANIALSNESSANESTIPDSKINHQYSKTFEFESDFDWYVKNFIHKDLNYFSFLRPVNELQIAGLFSKLVQHHQTFRSCNVGSKKNIWCGTCPKCLFTYIILSPFIADEELVNVFGKDMYNDNTLVNIFHELTGEADVKPFECVGTPEEVRAAIIDYTKRSKCVKPLLVNFNQSAIATSLNNLLLEYNTENLLPERFEILIKKALNDQFS
jgi:UDP-N-acetyl-alpha-D-muramoyl-L-alanyl-L-glutamate epimerase